MFQVGDTVVHPNYGAGIVTEVRKLEFRGTQEKPYYWIKLLSQPETTVMVAVKNEEKVGLRSPIAQANLERVWRVLRADPEALPSDHNKRYHMLKEKLHRGDVFEITEVLRDLAWRRQEKRKLTTRGKRLYRTGLELLASEVAGAQGRDFESVAEQIQERLAETVTATVA
jgi:CarD family transcriptional regulator